MSESAKQGLYFIIMLCVIIAISFFIGMVYQGHNNTFVKDKIRDSLQQELEAYQN